MTNAKYSQSHNITTTEMCDAAVTRVRFDRVQFIGRASIQFGLNTHLRVGLRLC